MLAASPDSPHTAADASSPRRRMFFRSGRRSCSRSSPRHRSRPLGGQGQEGEELSAGGARPTPPQPSLPRLICRCTRHSHRPLRRLVVARLCRRRRPRARPRLLLLLLPRQHEWALASARATSSAPPPRNSTIGTSTVRTTNVSTTTPVIVMKPNWLRKTSSFAIIPENARAMITPAQVMTLAVCPAAVTIAREGQG